MLKNLHIENIAVIEKTDIDFSFGFHALTGETGAGKSIIIDAINAVLGERTSKELIRTGCDTASVSALFGNLSAECIAILEENGFEPDEDGNLLIRRVLSLTGNGSVRINGKASTVGILRKIGASLVTIHGQHDNQGLLNPDNHYLYVDRLAENDKKLDEYYAEFKNFNAIRRKLTETQTDEDEKQRKISLLQYQINELSSAGIRVGEAEELKAKLTIAENHEKTLKGLTNAYLYLNGTDTEDGAVSMLSNAQKWLSGLVGSDFEDISKRLGETLSQLDDIGFSIRKYTEDPEFLELDGETIHARLDVLNELMRKYGGSEQAMLEFLDDASRQLEDITLSDERAAALEDELEKSSNRLVALGEKLTASRKAAAEKFSRQVTEILHYLDMPDAVFTVSFEKGRYTKIGCDIIEFFIGTNIGEEIKPLQKIASGGELSRIMLSIKSVLADKDDVDTLIFDEIDSGISGRAAGKVGIQLYEVSKSRQVLCVTHLAQIAANADVHLLIEKSVENGRTRTTVKPLSYDDRIKEVARIMSGTDMTDNLYNSAKEMLDRRNNNGNL